MTTARPWRRLALGLVIVAGLAWRSARVVGRQDHDVQTNASPTGPGPWASWWGFSAPWDVRSATSVREHGRELGAVVTGWVALDTVTLQPTQLYHDSASADLQRFALVTNYFRDRFRPESVRRLAGDPALLTRTTDSLATLVASKGYRGIVIDFEAMTPADTAALTTVVHAIATRAHARGIAPVAITVVAADSATYPARALLGAGADRLIVMVYDEHWSSGTPGPIASPRWARSIVAARVAEARSPSQLVVAVPVYGYEWRRGAPTVVVGADDARRLAASWHTTLTRDTASLNLRAAGPDSTTIWVADGTTADTLAGIARHLGVRTFAIWRLGLDDSAFWIR